MKEREIKFRAWIKKEYDQCGGFMLYDPDNESTDYFMVSNGKGFAVVFDDEWLKDDMYIIEQFTGLKDKNGVEIYEGDIVIYDRAPSGKVFKSAVCWADIELGWGLEEEMLSESNHVHLEVIGNIHEITTEPK